MSIYPMTDSSLPDFSEAHLHDSALLAKYRLLLAFLKEFPQALIGFSGGVDSTLLAGVARHVLGKERVIAYLAVGPSLAKQEHLDARELAELMDIRLIEYSATEFANPAYVANGPDRCFHCKNDLFLHLGRFAKEFPGAAILYGGNTDDTSDFRPGRRAATEHGALAPMAEAGLSKADIRSLSRAFRLPTAEKAAQPCLSSRIPYGHSVNVEKLAMVEAGEALLSRMGFREFRLRHFGTTARIEVPRDQFGLWDDSERAENLFESLRDLGFLHTEIDPQGFRSGSLNEALSDQVKRISIGLVN